jgi:hypothetical protein
MNSAPRISLLLTLLLGFAWPGLGQGSLACYTTSAQDMVGRGRALASSSTNGFTISAHREFDRNLAITVSAATRYWFLDSSASSEAQLASNPYRHSTPWAQASSRNLGGALVVAARSPNAHGVLSGTRSFSSAGYAGSQFETAVSLYDEGQLAAWVQKNVRFAKVDPTAR